MPTKPLYQTKTATLAAGAITDFQSDAFLRVLKSTGDLTIIATGANDFGPSGATVPTRVAIGGPLNADGSRQRIGPVRIQNNTGGAVTFTIATSNAPIEDARDSVEVGIAASVTITGTVTVAGPDAAGAAASQNPVTVAGYDGAAVRRILTDNGGRIITIGAVAAGSAIGTTPPVLCGGSDGTNVQRLKTDTAGNQTAVGAVAAGSAIGTTAPVLGGGSDGTNVQRIKVDTSGNQVAVGAVADGSAVGTTAPVMAGASDGTNVRRLNSDTTGALNLGNSRKGTYSLSVLAAAPVAANYILAAIEAGSAKIARIRRLRIHQRGSMTAAGRVVFSLLRTTAAATGGTTATPAPHDSTDAAYSGIVRHTGPTITAGTVLWRGSLWIPAALGDFTPLEIDFARLHTKALHIPAGVTNGIAFRCDTGGAGFANFDFTLEFTDE